jgi:hypothetical protein
MRAVVAKMGIFEGKTPAERNKMIAAAALGLLSLLALYLAFFRGSSSSSTSVTVKTASPTPRNQQSAAPGDTSLPAASDQEFQYQTTAVVYTPGNSYAPDPGRNIFAFYEPPPPCTDITICPPPTPKPAPPTATPTPVPTPPLLIASAQPQSVYAGSAGFQLAVTGNEYPVGTRIYFNQTEMPTKQVAPNRLTAEIPSNLIKQEGPRQIIVQTPDGKMYSNQMMMNVQAPPKPTAQYIGMIARKRYNNDTAVFTETPNGPPISRRLNDVINGRFRIIEISASQVLVEDVSLGFKHPIPIAKGSATAGNLPPGFGQPRAVPVPQRPGDRPDVDDNDPPRF